MNSLKTRAVIFSIGFIMLVLSPIKQNWAKEPKDSFPLSYYPMFSKRRPHNYGMQYVVGHDTLGNRFRIHYKLTGTGGFNQVRRQINRAHKKGRGIPFLEKVSHTISKKEADLHGRLLKLELVKGYYNLEGYFLENDTLPVLERKIATYLIEDHGNSKEKP